MSELIIKKLALRMVQDADFQAAMVNTVCAVLQKVITEDYAGERLSLYAAKRPASHRRERDQQIREQWAGNNCKQLSKQYNLTPRMVRKIATGK